MNWPSALAGVVPVLLFLLGLVLMDGYKLVRRRDVLQSLAMGCAVALLSYALHTALLEALNVPPALLKRVIAPVLEETLKALWIVFLIRRGRVAFLVDAGIHGFAVGTGFALIENLYYASVLGHAPFLLWLIRGAGTAVMHGSTTAIFAIVTQDLVERRRARAARHALPGWLAAIAVHGSFNQLVLDPLLTSGLLLVTMPLLLVAAFERSERATREWLGVSLDRDAELLERIHSGAIADSDVGRYLESLRTHFEGPVVADMLCLLEIHAELAMRAKGVLIARAAGVELPADPGLQARFAELKFLRRSIGPAGMMAIQPVVKTSERDLWQIGVLR